MLRPVEDSGEIRTVYLDPSAFQSSVAGVARAYDAVAETISQLAHSAPGGAAVFGDNGTGAACEAFHIAWQYQTDLVASAIAEVAELLPSVSKSFHDADAQGGGIVDALPDIHSVMPESADVEPPLATDSGGSR